MSVVLGINAFHAGASAAIVIDGKAVSAVAEERLNRVKYYAGFPALAIRECLRISGIKFRDVEHIAIGRDSGSNLLKKLQYVISNPSKLLNLIKIKNRPAKDLDNIKALILSECGASEEDLKFTQHNIEHHLSHIASSYLISPWNRCAGLSVDGSGDFVTVMMADCQEKKINVLRRIHVPNSLGSFYSMVCEFIGYDKYGDEGKVMGLAPYGEPTYKEDLRDLIQLTPTGFTLNPDFFVPFGANQGFEFAPDGTVVLQRHFTEKFVERFGPPRIPGQEITKREKDLAYAVQHVFEEGYIHLLNQLHSMVSLDKLTLAGGCALNSVANGKIFDMTPFRSTVIQPAAGDEGLALGAALYTSISKLGDDRNESNDTAYLGPEYDRAEIEKALVDAELKYSYFSWDELVERTASELAQGRIIGWFQGRMEWGPRALGNRSIIAHPGLPGMKDSLNSRIENRESFRPFAPAVLAERQTEIFEQSHPSPWMLHVYKIKREWRHRLSAVNHIDDTGRLQTVTPSTNPLFYKLISTFAAKTGIPVIVNTSFNENEPIVCLPKEAIDCYKRTLLDTLVIGPFICRKSREYQ